MTQLPLISTFLAFVDRLKFRNLFLLTVGLFVVDVIVPDFIPMIDEIILGLLAILLTNRKKEKTEETQGETIEGEVINENDEK